jgi:hypothetical protein
MFARTSDHIGLRANLPASVSVPHRKIAQLSGLPGDMDLSLPPDNRVLPMDRKFSGKYETRSEGLCTDAMTLLQIRRSAQPDFRERVFREGPAHRTLSPDRLLR